MRKDKAAIARGPDPVTSLLAAGQAARRVGDGPAAIASFRRAADLSPERPAAAFLLCATLLEAGDPDALGLLESVSTRFPADAPGWDEIGRTLARAGKPGAALAAFSRAYAAAPSVTLGVRRAAVLKEIGQKAEAREALIAARAVGPLPPRACFMLGLLHQDLGDLPASAEAYRAALDLDPDLAEAAVNLGIVRQETGDLEGAKSAYREAVRRRSDTFGRVAQALTSPPRGELWLDLDALRAALAG